MKILLLLILLSPAICATEILRWERVPLPVALAVGQERVIQTDRPFRVGYPPSLDGKLRIQSAGGMIYLRASTTFPPARIQLRDVSNGELILLDISASELPSPHDAIRLVYGSDDEPQKAAALRDPSQEPLPVRLVRYAAQSLYAPLRTVEPLPGVSQIPVPLPASLSSLLPDIPVSATPLIAWSAGDFTVTAIRLKNQSDRVLVLDPRDLQGQFQAAAFQHDTLEPSGSPADTSVVYLVTHSRDVSEVIPLESPAGGIAECAAAGC